MSHLPPAEMQNAHRVGKPYESHSHEWRQFCFATCGFSSIKNKILDSIELSAVYWVVMITTYPSRGTLS